VKDQTIGELSYTYIADLSQYLSDLSKALLSIVVAVVDVVAFEVTINFHCKILANRFSFGLFLTLCTFRSRRPG